MFATPVVLWAGWPLLVRGWRSVAARNLNRPGEKVPVDGEVLEGRCSVDESMVTGESMLVIKEPGAKVIGGTLGRTGSFVMRAEPIELERYSGSNKIWATKVKRLKAGERDKSGNDGPPL